ncbi:hypothetical protein VIGAN_02057600, partial [Vigna angularis var. angularis]
RKQICLTLTAEPAGTAQHPLKLYCHSVNFSAFPKYPSFLFSFPFYINTPSPSSLHTHCFLCPHCSYQNPKSLINNGFFSSSNHDHSGGPSCHRLRHLRC